MGVSVGWRMDDHGEQILKLLEEDVLALESLSTEQADKGGSEEVQTFSRQRPKWLRILDKIMLSGMLGIDTVPPPPEEVQAAQAAQAAQAVEGGEASKESKDSTESKESKGSEAKEVDKEGKQEEKQTGTKDEQASEPPEVLCTNLQSSPLALVIFKTEDGRDAALEKCKESFTFREAMLKLRPIVTEPMGVQWENMAINKATRRERLFASIKIIVIASAAWAVCIYLPYALYASSFSYSNGDKPSAMMSVALTVIVVLGNLLMYTTCAEAAKRIGHVLRDTEEGVYMVEG